MTFSRNQTKPRKKQTKAPFDYSAKWSMRSTFLLASLFLYAPIIVLIVFSFNNSRRGGNVIWKGFTTKYYAKAFGNEDLMLAFGNSLTIAFISTIISVFLGAITAVLLWRFRFSFKPVFEGLVSLPIVIPEICMGVSLVMFFNLTGTMGDGEAPWPFNLTNIIIGHITFSFPFAAMVIRARLNNFNREMEEAAKDLGANEFQVF
ncbi:MAG: ABC transporter permease, partial [Alphaproteobacteria bacterium]